jgi:nickel/cobalt transporter (NicO) family protein
MNEIIAGSLVIILLHALLPNHWLPIIAIGKQKQWTLGQITQITLLAGLAHALSTVLIGWALAFLGWQMGSVASSALQWVSPLVLISIGIWFVYSHHTHHHFHLDEQNGSKKTMRGVLWALCVAMFFSPCLEIEAYFLLAGTKGWSSVLLLSGLYIVLTISGMALWVRTMYYGLLKYDWHRLEHYAGLISGVTLILTGILSFYVK